MCYKLFAAETPTNLLKLVFLSFWFLMEFPNRKKTLCTNPISYVMVFHKECGHVWKLICGIFVFELSPLIQSLSKAL